SLARASLPLLGAFPQLALIFVASVGLINRLAGCPLAARREFSATRLIKSSGNPHLHLNIARRAALAEAVGLLNTDERNLRVLGIQLVEISQVRSGGIHNYG